MSPHLNRTDAGRRWVLAALALALSLALVGLPAFDTAPIQAANPPITITADPATAPGGGTVTLHIRLNNVKDAKLDGQKLNGNKIDKKVTVTQNTTFTVTATDKQNNQPVTQSVTVAVTAVATPGPTPVKVSAPLPGDFALQTSNGHFLTALGGGGKTQDAVHTDATKVGGWEKFKLVPVGLIPNTAIQTSNGHYLRAVEGGGVAAPGAIQTDATGVSGWEIFRLLVQGDGRLAIQTINGNYLTAVGGGGKTQDPIHSDATNPSGWEMWRPVKIGDLGDNLQYAIWSDVTSRYLTTSGAGGPANDSVEPNAATLLPTAKFTLRRQPDGSYGIVTSDEHYVTALGGGGKSDAPFHANSNQVGTWEKFSFIDNGDGTYLIQTANGDRLGLNSSGRAATNGGDMAGSQSWRLIWCSPSF